MDKIKQHSHLINCSLFATTLIVLSSCNDFSQFDCFQQETGCARSTAGSFLSMPMAGYVPDVPSNQVAGTEVAGIQMAGTESAGAIPGGTEAAGTEMAGELMAGIHTAGEVLAGTEIAGMDMAGMEIAGMDMAGSPANSCDPESFDVPCLKCNTNGNIIKLANDDRCPEVECPPTYRFSSVEQVCLEVPTELSQNCIDQGQQSVCAQEQDCQPVVQEEDDLVEAYDTPNDECYQIIACTGDEDTDITWGCQVNGSITPGVCDQNENCHPNQNPCTRYALTEALASDYHLKVCDTNPQDRCRFMLENSHEDDTCDDICEQRNNWSCLGRMDNCSSNNPDANKCDNHLRDHVCVCQLDTAGN